MNYAQTRHVVKYLQWRIQDFRDGKGGWVGVATQSWKPMIWPNLSWKLHTNQWRIQSANSQSGIIFLTFCRKLHKNERIWTRGCPWCPPLDPSMQMEDIWPGAHPCPPPLGSANEKDTPWCVKRCCTHFIKEHKIHERVVKIQNLNRNGTRTRTHYTGSRLQWVKKCKRNCSL